MATEIRLTRSSPHPTLADLQNDIALAEIGQELAPLLKSKPLQDVTAAEVFAFLANLYDGVTREPVPYFYWREWDPINQVWIHHCEQLVTIVVPDPPMPGNPRHVAVREEAVYAP